MSGTDKTNAELIEEIRTLQGRLAELERPQDRQRQQEVELEESGQRLKGIVSSLKRAQEALAEAAGQWQDIFDAIADPVLIIGKDYRVMRANQAMKNAFAGTDVLGTHCYQLFHGTDAPIPDCPAHRAFCAGEGGHAELCEEHLGGRWFDIFAYPLRGKGGTVQEVVHIVRDITERKQGQLAFQMLVESIVGGIGQDFFDGLTSKLCEWLGCECAVVGEITSDGKSVAMLSMQVDGEKVPDYTHALAGTPCGRVAEKGYFAWPEGVCELFPDDRELAEMGAEGYVGTPLRAGDGSVIGVLCAMSRHPLNLPLRTEEVMSIMAARASPEVERKRMEETLLAYQQRLRSLASELSLTEEQERRQIVAELHDHVGPTLAICKMKLEAMLESASSTGMAEELQEIQQLIAQTINEARTLTLELSHPLLYTVGLAAALKRLTEHTAKRHGIMIQFRDEAQSELLEEELQVVLYRAVRELLVNVVKHAHGQTAKVSIHSDSGNVRIEVQDDGVGFDTAEVDSRVGTTGGFGLFNIRERLDYLGGKCLIESKPGRGTRVTLMVPLRREGKTA